MFPFQEFYSSGATRRHRNMYLHQSQDPCLPQDRKRRQIHDTFCVPRNCKLQEKRGKLMLPSILIYIYIFLKKISIIFIFSSLLDIMTLFEIYFWPCSINSRYMLQLPVLRHCFSSYNSHVLLLVLDIAQALAHLNGQILMVSPFPIKHQNINKFLHLSQYLKSIAEMVYDELCWHLKHQKSPISKFIIIFSKQFFLFSLSLSYYR